MTFKQYKFKKDPKNESDFKKTLVKPVNRVKLQMALMHQLFGQIGTQCGRKNINFEELEAIEKANKQAQIKKAAKSYGKRHTKAETFETERASKRSEVITAAASLIQSSS